ncbi:MAG: hypothetical protein ABSE72_00340 [Bacteroidales bacterium]|jgi:hypothetical protein
MKITAFTMAVSFLLLVCLAKAQDCSSSFFLTKEGTKLGMTSYDKNGKETGKSVTTLVSIRKNGTVTEYSLKSEITDSKGKIRTMDYTATCEGDKVSVSMKSFLPSDLQKSSGGADMQIEGNDIIFPNSVTIGEKLNDGNITMTVSIGAMTMKTTINIINRSVTGKESVTTPAGTWDCYKIEYNIETTVMNMTTKGKVRQWIAKGIGTVKSENYSEKGDLTGYSQVTSIN